MYKNFKISVVIPAYNEEEFIEKTILSVPEFTDKIIVVNDGSSDETENRVKALKNDKIHLINHEFNKGVGAAVSSGYKYSLKNNFDYTVVMAGDGQMKPCELLPMLEYMIKNKIDYIKGNRFLKPLTLKSMPLVRIMGSLALSLMTKFATGYYHIGDPQSGYTIINISTLRKMDIDKIYFDYGYPNDILGKLSIIKAKVSDYPVSAVYEGQQSNLKPLKVIVPYSKLLFRIYKERKKHGRKKI